MAAGVEWLNGLDSWLSSDLLLSVELVTDERMSCSALHAVYALIALCAGVS